MQPLRREIFSPVKAERAEVPYRIAGLNSEENWLIEDMPQRIHVVDHSVFNSPIQGGSVDIIQHDTGTRSGLFTDEFQGFPDRNLVEIHDNPFECENSRQSRIIAGVFQASQQIIAGKVNRHIIHVRRQLTEVFCEPLFFHRLGRWMVNFKNPDASQPVGKAIGPGIQASTEDYILMTAIGDPRAIWCVSSYADMDGENTAYKISPAVNAPSNWANK